MIARLHAPAVGLLLLLAAVLLVCSGSAAAATATASLSSNSVAVGDSVEMRVEVSGASQVRWSGSLSVEGLQIDGPQMSRSLQFGRAFTTSITFVFSIAPERAGTFTIPALQIQADGQQISTEPLKLTATAAGSAGSSTQGAGEPSAPRYFAQLLVPRESAYVGETLQVELRLHVDAQILWEPTYMPSIDGEGFTKVKIPNPRRERARRDGREYDVLVFRTAITPSKAGKIKIGPSEIVFDAQIPRAQKRRSRSRSLFDDFFDSDVFNDPMFAQRQRLTTTAEAVELEIKPLPTAGRPPSFSGAVGQFKFSAEGSPTQVKIGDPVTMKMLVSGRGNFDRVNAPAVADSKGWHIYPATGNFTADDELGVSGTKSFEMAVVPEEKHTSMPVLEFSYFDPEAGKYVTLTSPAAPLIVEGDAVPKPPPVSQSSVAAAPAPTPPAPDHILGLRYDVGQQRSFEPLYRNRTFVAAQAAPAAALLGFLIWRRTRKDEHSRVVAALRRHKTELWRTVRSAQSADSFYDAASRLLQVDAALATGGSESTFDAAGVCRARQVDEQTAHVVQEIFEARAARVYAGRAAVAESFEEADRTRVLAALERYEKCHAAR
jgi:hypothetical protein